MRTGSSKLNSVRGISTITAILLVLVIVMCVVVSVPTVKYYQSRSAELACAAGLDTARRQLAQEYMHGDFKQSGAEAMEAVAYAMNGWDDLCPSGGKVYLVENESEDMPFTLLCGMHDKDKKRCTRLNSDYVLDQLNQALKDAQKKGTDYPEILAFRLNGKQWKAQLVDEETGIRRGTSTTKGLEKEEIVAYYGIMGHSDFCADCGAAEGTICYLSFADEKNCANWRADDGWTGSSYEDR